MKFLGPPSSGSNAGTTWSHNKGGQYTRNRRTPTNPNSVKQQAIRNILGALSSAWSALTANQQTEWNDWAAINPVVDTLGSSINLSGHQAFVMLNSRLLQSGSTVNNSPPAGAGPGQLLTATVTATSPATISVAFTATPLAAGQKLMVWQTLPSTLGRNPNMNQARQIGYGAAATASPLAITSVYPGVVGTRSNFFVTIMDSAGRIAPPIKAQATFA